MLKFDQTISLYEEQLNEDWRKKLATGLAVGGLAAGAYNYAHNDQPTDPLLQNKQTMTQNQQTITQNQQVLADKQQIIKNAMDHIKPKEVIGNNLYNKPYKNRGSRTWTVGIGFDLEQPSAKKDLARIGVDYNKLMAGGSLSNSQVWQLFRDKVVEKYNIVSNSLPQFHQYPPYVQNALINMAYRGEFKTKYKFVDYIRNNQWTNAAHEYLKNDEYETNKVNGTNGGVVARMLENQQALLRYAKELKDKTNASVRSNIQTGNAQR